jgi:Rod binding domain-containing protein
MDIKAVKQNIPLNSPRKTIDDSKYIPEPYKKVAQGMEGQFAQFMLAQMEKTIHHSKPESSAEKYYKSLLTQKRPDKMSQNGGLGIQEMILNQIYPKRLRNPLTYNAYRQREHSLIHRSPQIQKKDSQTIEKTHKETL